MASKAITAMTVTVETLVYIGPAGQESPLFGVLVPGQSYQAETAFAAYLVAQHPAFWRRPDA